MTDTAERMTEVTPERMQADARPETRARARLALWLAIIALAAALVGAVGPAERVRTTYAWPPATLPDAQPDRMWFAPLLVARYTPERITAEIPCALPPALPKAGAPPTVLATTRSPKRGGLDVLLQNNALVVNVGRISLARIALPPGEEGEPCRYRLSMGGDRWSIERESAGDVRTGELATMPTVSGLFSELDLRRSPRPTIEVTTAVHATHTTARQALVWILAGSAAVAALFLLALQQLPRLSIRGWLRGIRRAVATRSHPADAVVMLVLIGWWILSPAFFDDGWVVARQRVFASSGGFSNYYDTLGVNLPNGYWLEWLQHWVVQSSDALPVLRTPALVCLAAVWVLCRWALLQVLRNQLGAGRVAIWTMAAAFTGSAVAWGMTLRPEPVTALLTTGVLLCALRLRERTSRLPLVFAALLLPLALTGHHAGIVAIAPLLAVAPDLWRWGCDQRLAALTLLASASAIVIALFSLGADVDQRLTDTSDTRAFSTGTDDWYDELLRYERLGTYIYSTPLRRASVALMLLVVVAFLIRRRRAKEALNVPATSLGIGLALLIATPSKHPWHFGALMGVFAVAAACEATRMRREAERADRLRPMPLAYLAAVFVAAGWAWSVRGIWNIVDLRTLDWRPGIEAQFPFQVLVAVLPVIALFAFVLSGFIKRGRNDLYAAPWRASALTTPILMVPAIAFTIVVLAADSAKSESWTLARQNLDTLRGDLDCGLADELRVVHSNGQGETVPLAQLIATSPTLVMPDTVLYFPCAQLPQLGEGIVEVPEYVVANYSRKFLVGYDTSPFLGLSNLFELKRLELGPDAPREIEVLAVDSAIPGSVEVKPMESSS